MFKFIKEKIQRWKFMRELKKIKPICIVVEETITFVEKPKKKVKKNAKRK